MSTDKFEWIRKEISKDEKMDIAEVGSCGT
jgi:hypothetical protein